ncbi:hypothetical protein [Xanthobacter sp. 91]|uniref:hypothetical protein n=1 Tax=Xanthobacter sp. 91 TaxID=1117244 RepID=UPI0012DC2554|nr:hypothetical protein [Xanthobacter sp. 91]
MTKPTCMIYSLAFGAPKPMHRFIFSNWASADFANFRLFTDQAENWREMIHPDTSNIEIIDTQLLDWFRAFFPYFHVSSHAELIEKYPDFFREQLTGWNACCLKPLFTRFDNTPTPAIWGWVDYDVLLNPSALERHLIENEDKDLLMFPEGGGVWEQFKLFRSNVDVTDLCQRIIDAPRPDPAPLDVMVSYQIRGLGSPMDDIAQNMVASHWKYSDCGDFPENKFGVIIDNNMKLTSDDGREILFFIADTETKYYTENDVKKISEQLDKEMQYKFDYVPAP